MLMDNKLKPCNFDKNDNQVNLYPVILPESEVTFETESVNSDCEQWTGDVIRKSPITDLQTSSINVEQSSDVVIGPLTQFHGPVTIYQNVNSDNLPRQENFNVEYKAEILNGSAKPPPESTSSSEKLHPTEEKCSIASYKRRAICSSIILIMLLTIIISIAVSINTTSSDGENKSDKNTTVPDRYNSTLGQHIIFTKKQWGGRPSLNFTKPLNHPTKYVLISHTAGKFCNSYEECAPMLLTMQSYHVEKNSPDIGYNFLIGGDGNIYIGRGWDIQNYHRNHNIGISFMGNFVFDSLTTDMVEALKKLLDLGVQLKKLAPDYKLVCHNQTYATLSPGRNVFKEMTKFPHYSPGRAQIPK